MSVQTISGGGVLVSTQPTTPVGGTETKPAATKDTGNLRPPTTQPAVNVQPEKPSASDNRKALQDAVQRANDTVHALRSNLQFSVDEKTGIDVVKFIDIKTKEVIRQIPSEEMLALAQRLDEIKGLLIKDKA